MQHHSQYHKTNSRYWRQGLKNWIYPNIRVIFQVNEPHKISRHVNSGPQNRSEITRIFMISAQHFNHHENRVKRVNCVVKPNRLEDQEVFWHHQSRVV